MKTRHRQNTLGEWIVETKVWYWPFWSWKLYWTDYKGRHYTNHYVTEFPAVCLKEMIRRGLVS